MGKQLPKTQIVVTLFLYMRCRRQDMSKFRGTWTPLHAPVHDCFTTWNFLKSIRLLPTMNLASSDGLLRDGQWWWVGRQDVFEPASIENLAQYGSLLKLVPSHTALATI